MSHSVSHIVIVGGGTAGWLAACRLAAAARPGALAVTVVESPDVPTIGVGEGTWPTMRRTLAAIGIAEADFLRGCDAAFKQGSRFDGWVTGDAGDSYHHPFTAPAGGDPRALVAGWQAGGLPFAQAMGPQPQVAEQDLAPRQRAMPDYAGALNYAYHLDAGKLAVLLRDRALALGVRHVRDHVERVDRTDAGDVAAVATRAHGAIAGDLFLDCTGHAALLIGGAMGVKFVDRSDVLFNDRALAVQVPVAPGSPIASTTNATAHAAGWIWDIGLPARRGVGCVYASAFMDDDTAAATLSAYLGVPDASFRRLTFRSGHRARFWHGNVLAVGLSAGFLEPLEASAIVTIELALDHLIANFPATTDAFPAAAARFNAAFRYRWDRIVEFLKLHYVLSRRTGPYWRAHRDPASIPARLRDLLDAWRHQPPSDADLPDAEEVFPAASYRYILYGMGFPVPPAVAVAVAGAADDPLAQVPQQVRALTAALPTHRAYLDALSRPMERLAR
ncbi:tryptophan halogenase [Sphingomonas sp. Leaf412]|uniref:tryptophan halogenase family protein n=1 Tax=Sphingomonas sp. Leaf412 TaxID=1736370 RepID=UPI0006F500C9|nr:tryptophan halogenase family protein [Sphingomonas sp. Leaf412]KQT31750.1 tryptophan halogenase [Sphingomonas sp. Leaf412]